MAGIKGEFRIDLGASDAIVACAEALEQGGWIVDSVEAHRIETTSPPRSSQAQSSFELTLEDAGDSATTVFVDSEGREASWEQMVQQADELKSLVLRHVQYEFVPEAPPTMEPVDEEPQPAPTAVLPARPNQPVARPSGPVGQPTPAQQEGGFAAWIRRHPRAVFWTTLGVALFVGIGIGAAGSESDGDSQQSKIDGLENQLSRAQGRADRAESTLAEKRDDLDQRAEDLSAQAQDAQDEIEQQKQELTQREGAVADAEQTLESNTIPDGVWQLDRDFEAGLYRAPGGSGCYWALLGSADTADIINNGGFTKNQTLTIDSPFFETADCGEWTKIG